MHWLKVNFCVPSVSVHYHSSSGRMGEDLGSLEKEKSLRMWPKEKEWELIHDPSCGGVTFQDSSFVHSNTLGLVNKVDACLWCQCCYISTRLLKNVVSTVNVVKVVNKPTSSYLIWNKI